MELVHRIRANASPAEIERVYDGLGKMIASGQSRTKSSSPRPPYVDAGPAVEHHVLIWAIMSPRECNDDVLAVICRKELAYNPAKTFQLNGAACPKSTVQNRSWSIPEILLQHARFDVLEHILRVKLIHLEDMYNNVTIQELIMRLKEEAIQQRLLSAGRTRTVPSGRVEGKQLFPNLVEFIEDTDTLTPDLVLVLNDGADEVSFHRSIVKNRSDYFAGMLSSGMSEATTGRVIINHRVSRPAMVWVRAAMYKGSTDIDEPEESYATEALEIAGWMGLGFVVEGLARFMAKHLTSDTFWAIYGIGYRLRVEELLEVCYDFAETHMAELVMHPHAMKHSKTVTHLTRRAIKYGWCTFKS